MSLVIQAQMFLWSASCHPPPAPHYGRQNWFGSLLACVTFPEVLLRFPGKGVCVLSGWGEAAFLPYWISHSLSCGNLPSSSGVGSYNNTSEWWLYPTLPPLPLPSPVLSLLPLPAAAWQLPAKLSSMWLPAHGSIPSWSQSRTFFLLHIRQL